MKTFFERYSDVGFGLICLALPLAAFGLIYHLTTDLAYSLVASLMIAVMPPLIRFIYILNSNKKNI